MKKNMISIIVLGLVVANLVVSVITLMSVSKTAGSVTELVTGISSALALELDSDSTTVQPAGLTPDQIAVYSLSEDMTIAFKKAQGETTQHYCKLSVSLRMDTTNEDYETYKDTMAEKETLIKGIINDVVSNRTLEEMEVDQQGVRDEILADIQQLFGSNFIYQVDFSSYIPQ